VLLVVNHEHAQSLKDCGLRVAGCGLTGRLFLDTRPRVRVPQERKLDREGRAAPHAFRFGANCAAVQLDQVSHYREAEPESAVRARGGLVALPEAVEDEG